MACLGGLAGITGDQARGRSSARPWNTGAAMACLWGPGGHCRQARAAPRLRASPESPARVKCFSQRAGMPGLKRQKALFLSDFKRLTLPARPHDLNPLTPNH
ncbi:MAG: hypothetical protein GY862_13365 [Gammaproteobacteria bacterium]|nr:hypothetical protein [Gammaproteobacteria bacterium]